VRVANHLTLIRSFLIDFDVHAPCARQILQKIFAVSLHRIISAAT